MRRGESALAAGTSGCCRAAGVFQRYWPAYMAALGISTPGIGTPLALAGISLAVHI